MAGDKTIKITCIIDTFQTFSLGVLPIMAACVLAAKKEVQPPGAGQRERCYLEHGRHQGITQLGEEAITHTFMIQERNSHQDGGKDGQYLPYHQQQITKVEEQKTCGLEFQGKASQT